jgi:hypothetical protein
MILGIDPGTTESAYVILHNRNIVSSAKLPNFELRALLPQIMGYRILAIEGMQSYGLPVGREVLDTVCWIGRFIEASTAPVVWPVFRPAVRAHHLGVAKGKNGDAAIRKAMLTRYGTNNTRGITRDQWSALAVATFVSDKEAAGQCPPKFPIAMLHHLHGSVVIDS